MHHGVSELEKESTGALGMGSWSDVFGSHDGCWMILLLFARCNNYFAVIVHCICAR
jgi:hypothetical protein